MRIVNLLLLVSLLFVGCGEPAAKIDKPKTFDKDGLSFSYPSNWKVEEDSHELAARYVSIETGGDANTTILVFHESEQTLQEFADEIGASLKEGLPITGRVSEAHSKTVQGKKFDGIKDLITASVLGDPLEFTAEFYLLEQGKQKLYFMSMVATEDLAQVQPGFDLILGSLKQEENKG